MFYHALAMGKKRYRLPREQFEEYLQLWWRFGDPTVDLWQTEEGPRRITKHVREKLRGTEHVKRGRPVKYPLSVAYAIKHKDEKKPATIHRECKQLFPAESEHLPGWRDFWRTVQRHAARRQK